VVALLAVVAVAAVVLLAGGGDDPPSNERSADSGGANAKPKEPEPQPAEQQPTEQEPKPTPTDEQPEPEQPADTGATDPAEGARLDGQAYRLIQQGDYESAIPIARRAVASFPEDDTSTNYAFALFNLGTALNRSGNPEEAIPLFEKRLGFSDNQRDVVEAELADARKRAGG